MVQLRNIKEIAANYAIEVLLKNLFEEFGFILYTISISHFLFLSILKKSRKSF